MFESLYIIEQCLDQLPSGAFTVKTPQRPSKGEAHSRVEASRGELLHFILSNGQANPFRFKVRTPTLANFSSLQTMLSNAHLADVPVIISSIDPCIACCDRVQIVDIEGGKTQVWSGSDLRRYSLQWYQS
jgi:Ni,Fe-hydrogenase III large subunit